VRFVVDHIAKPRIAQGADPEWEERLAPFSDLGNVCCKLSGMVTEADWSGWRPDDLAPFVRRVVGWFGAGRLLFGSDWPVCLLAASYARVVDALEETLAGLPAAERAEVLGDTAARFYRLRLDATDGAAR
jgi:L-fuconolactonase